MNKPKDRDKDRYTLRAKALEQAEIDTTPQQVESLAGGEWDGEGLPPVGVECEFLSIGFNFEYEWCIFHGKTQDGGLIVEHKSKSNPEMSYCQPFDPKTTKFRKPETPQQRQEREELEAAYELYCEFKGADEIKPCSFDSFKESKVTRKQWIAVVRKTKYRKQ